jgi:hypothetical protein
MTEKRGGGVEVEKGVAMRLTKELKGAEVLLNVGWRT